MPYSTRKFIRSEKARIRRQFFDQKKQQELIAELYNKISGKTPVPVKETETAGVVKAVKEKQGTKNKEEKTKNKEQKTKNKEQKTKSKK